MNVENMFKSDLLDGSALVWILLSSLEQKCDYRALKTIKQRSWF